MCLTLDVKPLVCTALPASGKVPHPIPAADMPSGWLQSTGTSSAAGRTLLTVVTAGNNVQTADKTPLPAVWVLVQEAERKIPINYANRYRNAALSKQSYLPFKVRVLWQGHCRSPGAGLCPSAACRDALRIVLACDQPLHLGGICCEGLSSLGEVSQRAGASLTGC